MFFCIPGKNFALYNYQKLVSKDKPGGRGDDKAKLNDIGD